MTYLDTWRTNLKTHLAEFAPLAKEDPSINLIYGLTAAAVLWGMRDAPFNDEHKSALKEACGDEKHLPHLLKALGGWDDTTQLEAVRKLNKRQRESDELREALIALMGTFIEELFEQNMLQQNIDISGSVTGGNVNIGGYQIVAGDLIIQYIRPVISTCPTAPKPPDHFTGREAELQELRQRLTADEVVAITAVRAMGGMGKTTLAQALCHQPDQPFDAVLWASIGEDPQVTNILLEWARYAVDDYTLKPDARPEEIAGWVRAQLTQLMTKSEGCGPNWLVVFDDVWNKQSCYDTLALLQTALPPNTHTLITTRQADTASYLHAKSIELYELNNDDALSLMKKLSDNRHLSDKHLKRAIQLIKGHPLTLEIAIASLNKAEDSTEIKSILDDYERGIHEASPFDALNLGAETPRSLNVVFGRSYHNLAPEDQAHFRALGILAPSAIWNRSLAGALWEIEDEKERVQAHKTLRLAAFIQQDETAEHEYGGLYYRQHPLLRSYALALLNKQTETVLIFNNYVDHITTIAQGFDTLPLEQWQQLDPYLPHIDYLGDELTRLWQAENQRDTALNQRMGDFAYAVTNYVFYRPQMIQTERGPERRGLRWLEIGLEIYKNRDDPKRSALFCNQIGLAWSDLSEQQKALHYYEQARPLFRAVGDRRGEAATLTNIGGVWSALGEQQKALDYYTQALPLIRAVGDRGGEATTLTNIGLVWSALGEQQKALDYFKQALLLRRAVGDRRGEATTLHNIGGVWSALGEQQKALDYYEQALPLL
ncbi:hypothetical protein MASR2M15_04700 [Anaerolineales bacterium]